MRPLQSAPGLAPRPAGSHAPIRDVMQVVTSDSEEGHGVEYSHVHLIGGIDHARPPIIKTVFIGWSFPLACHGQPHELAAAWKLDTQWLHSSCVGFRSQYAMPH